jgi:hypothetical protein
MNVDGLREWLDETDEATKEKKMGQAGFGGYTDQQLVNSFVGNLEIRRQICDAIGVQADEDSHHRRRPLPKAKRPHSLDRHCELDRRCPHLGGLLWGVPLGSP